MPKKSGRQAKKAAAKSAGKTRVDASRAGPFVRGRLSGDWYERFDLYGGPTVIDGDLSLDGEDVDAIVVDGDLEVRGAIVNRNADVGVGLVVTGDVRANDVVAGGAEIVILGGLTVAGIVFGFYNHGSVTVHGATRAKAIITEYHAFDLRGRVDATTVSGRGRITKADRFSSYAPALVPEILTEGQPAGGYPDWKRTADAILAGRPVLRAANTRHAPK